MKLFLLLTQAPLIALLLLMPISHLKADEYSQPTSNRDGSVTSRESIHYRHEASAFKLVLLSAYVISIVTGGLVAFGGIQILLRSIAFGNSQSSADLDIDFKNRRLRIKAIAQGGVVVLIGAAVIIWAIYRIERVETPRDEFSFFNNSLKAL